MNCLLSTRCAAKGVLAVLVAWCCSIGLRAAEGAAAPDAGKPTVKGLLEHALADLDDAAAKQAVLRELNDVFPARLAELQTTAERNAEEATQGAAQLVQEARQLVDLKQDNPGEYERALHLARLEDECADLVGKARAAQGDARAPIVTTLKQKLGELFDARQDELNREIAAKAGELEELRRRVAKRAENRDLLIQRRALDLISDTEAEW
jgi:hypothetical protein